MDRSTCRDEDYTRSVALLRSTTHERSASSQKMVRDLLLRKPTQPTTLFSFPLQRVTISPWRKERKRIESTRVAEYCTPGLPRMRVLLLLTAVLSCPFCLTVSHALALGRTTTTTRAHFLSSVAASFTGVAVLGMDPTECDAAGAAVGSNNPRYIEKNLEMKYGETPGRLLLPWQCKNP